MKNFFTLLLFAAVFLSGAARAEEVVSGYITTNTTFTRDKVWVLQGFVYVTNGATLTIESGTLVKGDKATKGALIVTRGAKIIADGTADQPIVFTSSGPVGFRNYGDWGGIILLGKASINVAGGEAIIEGGVEDGQGNGTYGGGLAPNDADNSGIMRYVRIEFPGIAFQPNSEINGLTCGGVGNATILEHIQVSYCGDDGFEFFGGTVNAKYLVSFRSLDDDLDTDFGYRGKIQYAYVLRDPAIADVSGSNGFESDNDGTGTANVPKTRAIISNVTIAGPKVTSSTAINGSYKRGAHLRRNTEQSIYNSVIMGYPSGIMVDGSACESNATNDLLQVRNTILSGHTNNFEVASGSSFDLAGWFNNAAFGNATYTANADLLLTDAFNLTSPNPMPMNGSPVLTGADFTNANLADPFFDVVAFRGAFSDVNWTDGWTNWNPQQEGYTGIETPNSISTLTLYPNPMNSSSTLEFNLIESHEVSISILDLSGRLIREVLHDQLAAGQHQIKLQLSDLTSGMYFVNIQSGNDSRMIKLNVE
jgi:hypothetical protein